MRRKLVAAALIAALAAGCSGGEASPGYTLVTTWGTSGAGPGQFREPTGIAVDTEGFVYVADARHGRVEKLAPAGEPVMVFGTPGPGPGPFLTAGVVAGARARGGVSTPMRRRRRSSTCAPSSTIEVWL